MNVASNGIQNAAPEAPELDELPLDELELEPELLLDEDELLCAELPPHPASTAASSATPTNRARGGVLRAAWVKRTANRSSASDAYLSVVTEGGLEESDVLAYSSKASASTCGIVRMSIRALE